MSFPLASIAQEPVLTRLQDKMDSQEAEQKNLIYSFNTLTYVHKLDKNGAVEKSDTIRAWQKFKGDSLTEYKLLYSSDKKEKNEGKQERRESAKLPKLNDPKYDFRVDSIAGRIFFMPKKPQKGELSGEITYDPQSLDLKGIKATMPKMKWPVHEFSMEMSFTVVGGFLFPAEFRMQAGWNALVSQGRIRVESLNSDFMVYK